MITTFVSVTLSQVECCECHGIFAVSKDWEQQRRRDHKLWPCPYCRTNQSWPGESDIDRANRLAKEANDRLIRERAEHDQERSRLREQRDAANARTRAEKGAKTKLKKRIAAGVCPCCRRPFENLLRHMKHQHPDFVEAE